MVAEMAKKRNQSAILAHNKVRETRILMELIFVKAAGNRIRKGLEQILE